MKYTLRPLLCLLLALCLTLPLISCGGGKYNNGLSAANLCDSITAELATEDGWRAVSDNYISPSSWGEDYADYLEKVAEYRIVVAENAEMNIDEVGVFLCKSEKDAKDIKTFCENYLSAKTLQLTPLLESYNPHELHKLDYAAVTVLGRYVVYTILSPANTASAETAMEKALTPAE
jgi:hypothetical protein